MKSPPNSGVIYLHVGVKHANHLCVSLLSLRDIYDGPVAILTGGEASRNFLDRYILPEKRFGDLRAVEFEYQELGRGSTYYAKTSMGTLSPFERTVFIDCDTLVVGDFSEVFPVGDEVRLTQFANWTTLGRRISSRISKWDKILPDHVDHQLKNEHPGINTGVMGFSKGTTGFMQRWYETTVKNIGFICDEICAQLIYTDYEHVVLSDKYNASPVYSWKRYRPGKKQQAAIWHGHGKKFLKKSEEVQEALWLPYYRRAMNDNVGGIREWTDSRAFKGLIKPRKYLSRRQWRGITKGLDFK